ncbi:TonB-dependent receptor domain-containing protein [Flavivirga spongiicola]|uniref:TonB-dependent receptor n=1 Tax=Flavivirga spongiicola TaxID=421621 RepID=A0ABU7XXQ1_9FLAO|nr:TonB-dependent receptor [Flavivirga sp. MEBiC05379]MDO5980574.1 TonB-dependent receptor [Flavivirga sp. MEBiC05379]
MKTSINLYLFIFLFSTLGFSQNQIKGSITDASGEPLVYATTVLKTEKSELIEGVITNADGQFNLQQPKKGNYVLEIQYLGYEILKQNISIIEDTKNVDLGRIILKEDANALDEVVVQGNTAEVSLKLGKKVFIVGKDLTSQNGSANDILSNVPSVNVSPTGEISLRGNSNVQVMINGRQSALTQSQALEQLSADIIESVEVITNPSAKYDASGSAGIINIILKKNRTSGFNGQARLMAGTPADHRAIANVNYRTNKFNVFANVGIRYSDYEGDYSKQQTTVENGITTFLDYNEDEDRHDDGRIYYLGTDYFINDKNAVTVAYYRNETKDTDVTKLNYDLSDSDGNVNSLFTLGNSKEKRDYNQLEGNYTKTFDKKDQKFTIDFQYDFFNSNKKWTLNTDEVMPILMDLSDIRTIAKIDANDIVIQSDFTTPLNENSNFETGIKFENRSITNTFLAEELINGNFETIDNINNTLDYKEQIVSGYTQYNSKINKISYQVGLRLEATSIDIDASSAALNSKNNYTNLFPSANIGYEFTDKTSAQLSYSKRISRPSLWNLNPFFELKDFTSRFTGNPSLTPSYTDAFELSTIYKGSNFRLNPSIYYANTNDVFQYETTQDDNEVFTQKPINLDNEKRYGFELSATYNPLEWLRFSSDFNTYAFKQKGVINATNADFSDSTWFVNFTTNITPVKTVKLQTRLYYQGKKSTAQTETSAVTNLNFAINKSLFKNKGSIVFNISNALNSRKVKEKITGTNFDINQTRNRNAQRYSLSFLYKFNQKPTDRNREAKRSNRN